MNGHTVESDITQEQLSQHFDALIGTLIPELYRHALGPWCNPDLVQKTFLCTCRSQQTLRDTQSMHAWLYATVVQ